MQQRREKITKTRLTNNDFLLSGAHALLQKKNGVRNFEQETSVNFNTGKQTGVKKREMRFTLQVLKG